jgi:predicted small lipoprotein YifL
MPTMLARIAALTIAATMIAGLSGCGRKGDLDRPGVYESQKTDMGSKKVIEDKPFILDPLL